MPDRLQIFKTNQYSHWLPIVKFSCKSVNYFFDKSFFPHIHPTGCHGNRLWAAVHLLSEIERRRKLCLATKIAFSLSVGHKFGSRWGILAPHVVLFHFELKVLKLHSFFIHLFTFLLGGCVYLLNINVNLMNVWAVWRAPAKTTDGAALNLVILSWWRAARTEMPK